MRKLIGYILILSWDCHFLSLWPVHQMVDSYRNQGEEEQTWTLETGRLDPAWGLGLGLKGLWDWGRRLCSTPLASLWGKIGKVISRPQARALLEQGWPPTQCLQTNGFSWCDHYLMRCEGGRTQHKWHFPVEREIMGDVTALFEGGQRKQIRTGLCLSAAQAGGLSLGSLSVFRKSVIKFCVRWKIEVAWRLFSRLLSKGVSQCGVKGRRHLSKSNCSMLQNN